ncbi:hypothetical protein [Dyella acidisoli]|uniref:Uncharacterized protein n=1 Tax=Dyella acidisoli TaxID=1867834 RepID=A0ABQ5XLR6_9GAMM|nr:hypothetical protein [Dyella acidisoli]GLQ92645.1 hypothetical protein GCM10007901_15960 [Dyella acidisoli]
MKILNATASTSEAHGRYTASNDGTNFQQLMQGMEKDMWPGARPGPNPVSVRSDQKGMGSSSATAPFIGLKPDLAANTFPPGFEPAQQQPRYLPVMHAPDATRDVIPPYVAMHDSEHETLQDLFQAMPSCLMRMNDLAEDKSADLSNRQSVPCSARETSETKEPYRLTVLNQANAPAIVVRYPGDNEAIQRLRRTVQEALDRLGIVQASLIINGTEYPARMKGIQYGH